MNKDTRQRIIHAAMELFWLKGYASTSIADILSRSQVNSGSLYYFFPGKQDVLIAVLEAYRDGIEPMLLQPAWGEVKDPIEKVFALLAQYRRAIVDTDCDPDPIDLLRGGDVAGVRELIADAQRAYAPV